MPYEDGVRTLFYTKGTKGNPAEELRELLQYMENTEKANARNEALREIHTMVEDVKRDLKVSLGYMKMMRSGKNKIGNYQKDIRDKSDILLSCYLLMYYFVSVPV